MASHSVGVKFSKFITIHMNGIDPRQAQEVITKIMGYTRKWLKRSGYPHAHVWVLEVGREVGLHVHMLVCIPPNFCRKFRRLLANWLPFEVNPNTVNIRHVRYPSWGPISDNHEVFNTLRYMCKGIDPDSHSHRVGKPRRQGAVLGRRCGHSSFPDS